MKELIRIKDMYKIYNPGEDEVRALDGVSLPSARASLWRSSATRALANLPDEYAGLP